MLTRQSPKRLKRKLRPTRITRKVIERKNTCKFYVGYCRMAPSWESDPKQFWSMGTKSELHQCRRRESMGTCFNGKPLPSVRFHVCEKCHCWKWWCKWPDLLTTNYASSFKKYPGDPLNDFTVMRFLDRFVYKNPKAERKAPRSVNQRRVNKYLDTHQLPVTSLEFLKAKEHELGPHDRFMQK